MSTNIIDLIKGQLGPAIISQTASQLGESESGITKAIGGLLPAVVGGLANNADKPGVVDAITGAASSGILGNLLGGTNNNSIISTLLSLIFGDKMGGLVSTISNFAGIGNSSTSSLLNMVTGATLGSVGKFATDNNLGASGISSLLGGQKGIVSSLLPAGLSLASMGLNFGDMLGDAKEKVASTVSSVSDTVSDGLSSAKNTISDTTTDIKNSLNDNNDNGGGGSIWKWLLPLILLCILGYFLFRQCKKSDVTDATAKVGAVADSTAKNVDSMASTIAKKVDEAIDLNGVSLQGYKGGMEDSMITFLKSDGYKNAKDDASLKDTWYTFDHVNFKMGSSTELEDGSVGQLDNLVAILKAYPDAKIKIGAYTDKTGKEDINLKISGERAKFIQKWLTDKGVGKQVVDVEGYGSKFATVPADKTDEERAIDRKIAVRFSK
jgi:outer membrane protein OmpA-like peptidoglycan-associated protein